MEWNSSIHPLFARQWTIWMNTHSLGHLRICLASYHPPAVVEFIPAIVDWNNVHKHTVFGSAVKATDLDLERWKHPSEKKISKLHDQIYVVVIEVHLYVEANASPISGEVCFFSGGLKLFLRSILKLTSWWPQPDCSLRIKASCDASCCKHERETFPPSDTSELLNRLHAFISKVIWKIQSDTPQLLHPICYPRVGLKNQPDLTQLTFLYSNPHNKESQRGSYSENSVHVLQANRFRRT